MKRTQELWNEKYHQPEDLKGISALQQFTGEDLTKDSRDQILKQVQRQWLEEQMREKEQKRQEEKEEERREHERVMALNRIRAQMEQEHHNKRVSLQNTIKFQNKENAQQQVMNQKEKKNMELDEQREELRDMIRKGIKREFNPINIRE